MKTKLTDQSGVSGTEYMCLSARSSLSLEGRRHRVPANDGAGFSFPSASPGSKSQPGFWQLKQSRQLGHFCVLQHLAEPGQPLALAGVMWWSEGDWAHPAAAAWHWRSALPAQALRNTAEEKQAPLRSQSWDQFQKAFGWDDLLPPLTVKGRSRLWVV